MTTTSKTLNEVNLQAVRSLVSAIKDDPTTADTVWKATVDWKGGFRSEAKSRDFDPVPSDEPTAVGGDDTAPNPVEQLLGALGNCLAVGYAANASVAGVELKGLRIELEGDLDLHTFLGLKEDNAGYETITARVTIQSDTDPDTIRELHDKVVATSPVGNSLQRNVPVSVELT